MVDITKIAQPSPEGPSDVLEVILREGARKMLQEAILQEVKDYMEKHKALKDENGHGLVFRNGYLPEREILTGLGPCLSGKVAYLGKKIAFPSFFPDVY